MRCFGANLRINVPSLWHCAHTAITIWPAGLPLNPVAGAFALTLSGSLGLPP